jgi:phage baseplate assembly protein V
MPSETENLTQYGTIVAVDPGGRALVRAQVDDRVTDWIPYKMKASSYIKIWIPPQVGEQVEVVSPFGEGDSGHAEGSIYNKSCKEPEGANAHTTIIEWHNGARVVVDTEADAMDISNPGTVTMKAPLLFVDGNLKVAGTIEDVKGSVTSHFHTDVMPGTSNTGDRP